MARSDLTQEQLKEVLHYDPDTGVFRWLKRVSIRVQVGQIAGSVNALGYMMISINYRHYLNHRLAWLYMTGKWPLEIDHINGKREDNRFCNLRECNRSLNAQNIRNAKGSSGLLGAFKGSTVGWFSYIRTKGQRHYLGYFATKEEAHAAYIEAKRKLHPFGEL